MHKFPQFKNTIPQLLCVHETRQGFATTMKLSHLKPSGTQYTFQSKRKWLHYYFMNIHGLSTRNCIKLIYVGVRLLVTQEEKLTLQKHLKCIRNESKFAQ